MKPANCPWCGGVLKTGKLGRMVPYPDEGWLPVIDEVPAYHCPNCQIFLFTGRDG